MNIEAIKAIIDNCRKSGDTQFNVILTTESQGCDKLLKGRGANSIKNLLGLDLDTITKVSAYQALIGDVDYSLVKETNGYGPTVNKKTGDYTWVEGYEGILAISEKTGEYQLRYFINPEIHQHISTAYKDAEGEDFNPYAPEYAEFRKAKPVINEDHKNDILIRYIGIGKIQSVAEYAA